MNYQKNAISENRKTALHILWLMVAILFIGGINASAQTIEKPFHFQVQERIDYLTKVKGQTNLIKIISYETGLTETQVGDVIFGQTVIIDMVLLDNFCDALQCSFHIIEEDGTRQVNLIPFDLENKFIGEKIYDKSTGRVAFIKIGFK